MRTISAMHVSSKSMRMRGSFKMAVSVVTLLLMKPLVEMKPTHRPTLEAELNAFT